MSKFVCLKCNEILDRAFLTRRSPVCPQHEWVGIEHVTSQETERVFQRIVRTIDGAFKVGKYLSIILLAILALLGYWQYYELPNLRKEVETQQSKVRKRLNAMNEEKVQLERRNEILRSKTSTSIELANELSILRLQFDSLDIQTFSEQEKSILGIGRGEYEILLSEYWYTRDRLKSWVDKLFSVSADDNGQNNSLTLISPKQLKSRRRGFTSFLRGFSRLLKRKSSDPNYYFTKSVEDYEKSIRALPKFTEPYIKLASIYLDRRSRDLQKAKNYLEQAGQILKSNENNLEVLALNGYFFILKDKPREAKEYLEKAKSVANSSSSYPRGLIYFYLGLAFEKLSKAQGLSSDEKLDYLNKAAENYNAVVADEVYPHNEKAKNNLISLALSHELNSTKDRTNVDLIRMANDALMDADDDLYNTATLKDTLANVYFQFGEFEKATFLAQQAIDDLPMEEIKENFFRFLSCALYVEASELGQAPPGPEKLNDRCSKRGFLSQRGEKYPKGLMDLGRLTFLVTQRKYWMTSSGSETLTRLTGFIRHMKELSSDIEVANLQIQKEFYLRAVEYVSDALMIGKDEKNLKNFSEGEAWSRLSLYFLNAYEELRIRAIALHKDELRLKLADLPIFKSLLVREGLISNEELIGLTKSDHLEVWGYKISSLLYMRSLQGYYELRPDIFEEAPALYFDRASNNMAWAMLMSYSSNMSLAPIIETIRGAIRKRFLAPSAMGKEEDRPELYDTLAEGYFRLGDLEKAKELTRTSLKLLQEESKKMKIMEQRFAKVRTRFWASSRAATEQKLSEMTRKKGYYLCQLNRFTQKTQKEIDECLKCFYISPEGRGDCLRELR